MHLKVLLIIATMFLGSCKKVKTNEDSGSSATSFDLVEARKENLKLKRVNQLTRSLSKILAMNENQLCLELGKIPCTSQAHKVSLGGLAAYDNSQYEYNKESTITAPLALDRLVLSACNIRASLDMVNPAQGVIYKNLDITSDGRITKDDNFKKSIQTLYQRAFLRNPTASEYTAMENLYVDIYDKNSIGVGRNWAVLSCYTVLSSIEFIFY